ncbi:MAG: hypothetical protein Q8R39_04855 [bacterium]|nr:hypothetical protein [bacterium]MDZ4284762.1 hypothetical protein [Patescibacteria group bacterium]
MNTPNSMIVPVVVALILGGIGGYFAASSMGESVAEKEGTSSEVAMPEPSANTAAVNTALAGTDEWKIQNAMSAAPEAISKDATVLDWPAKEGDQLRPLRAGTNTWTCTPDMPTSPGNDPFCGDEMSMQWFGAYMSKKTPKIAQAGIGYMLQGGSDASNTDPFAVAPKEGEQWLSAPPHIMIFPVSKLDMKVYGTDPMSGKPWIMWAGTPYEHLMVPVQQ